MKPKKLTPRQQKLTFLPKSQTISAAIHLIGLLFSTASIAWLPNITNPQHNGFGGHYQFLTMIALMMTTITFVVGLLADVIYNEQLSALKNIISVCTTSVEVVIGILYWTAYAVDKSQLAPPGHALPFIPNLGLHAVPAVMLTLDMLAGPPWIFKTSRTMMLNSVLFFIYWAWLECCFSFNQWYPYPVLEHLSTWRKLFLCIFSAGLMTGSAMVLKWAHGRINKVVGLRSEDFDLVEKVY